MTEENDVNELVKIAIKTKILKALKDEAGYLDALVETALSTRVNVRGVKSRRDDYNNKHVFLDLVVGDAIRDACKIAVQEIVSERHDYIRECVRTTMDSKTFEDSIAKSLIDVLTNARNMRLDMRMVADRQHDDNET